MRQPNVGSRRGAQQGASKQKKQLMVLGFLAVTLGVVLTIQFGGDGDGEAMASTNAAAGSGASVLSGISQAQAAQPASVTPGELSPDNAVLVAAGESVRANPFASFWSTDEPEEIVEEAVVVLPPPNVTLSATMTSGRSPVAYVDGQIRRLGDVIGGWTLFDIGPRQIRLRSPDGNETTIAMPLLDAGR